MGVNKKWKYRWNKTYKALSVFLLEFGYMVDYLELLYYIWYITTVIFKK